MNMLKFFLPSFVVFASLMIAAVSAGAETVLTVPDLQARWAEVNYQLVDKAQLEAFGTLESHQSPVLCQSKFGPPRL